MKILKFGGKSLANGEPIAKAISIITKEFEKGEISLVLSARGNSTNELLKMYEKASKGEDFLPSFSSFVLYQIKEINSDQFSAPLNQLKLLLTALQNIGVKSQNIEDKIVAFGEILSALTVVELLKLQGIKATFKDSRELLFTSNFQEKNTIDSEKSKSATKSFFKTLEKEELPVITGFIASGENEETVTLGRNGSNYSATLIASFIEAEEVQNWTDINGIYSANPKYVKEACKIPHLSYGEANELANFGVNILHPKTISPLKKNNIPLKIFNSFNNEMDGTLIDEKGNGKGIKAVSIIENVSLVTIEGKGLLGKIGIDARIFTLLSANNISVRLISQASSERGIGFVVDLEDAELSYSLLQHEFNLELKNGDISNIRTNNDVAIIAIVGRHNYALEKAIQGLRRNKIWMHLISNSISGDHISLVVDNKNVKKAVNVVHGQVVGAVKTLNLFAFGKGTVGGKLLDQIIETAEEVSKRRNLKINIIGISDSKKVVFNEEGIGKDWRDLLLNSSEKTDVNKILTTLKESGLENIVVVDNTTSEEVTGKYPEIVKAGFDLVASNKKANSSSLKFYKNLRELLQRKNKMFFYETNVGAGLPIIDPLKQLYNSADSIQKIRGVFSGSLSYIFNNFSITDRPFSEILVEAKNGGYTEPDPREDLNGMDVARKLIILAREIGMEAEFEDIKIESLIPSVLENEADYNSFINRKEELNSYYHNTKNKLSENQVLRYVGELDVVNNKMEVLLVKVNKDSSLGSIKNADSIVEVYTENYGEQPIVIQGAGAGAEVTARGVYSDLLRVGSYY